MPEAIFDCYAGMSEDDLKQRCRVLRDEIERLRGLSGPFICGTVGEADTGGLHDGYVICPQYGSGYIAVFMQKRAE